MAHSGHDHSHSHDHGHGGSCSHNHGPPPPAPMPFITETGDNRVDLFNAVRYSMRVAAMRILEKEPNLANSFDDMGNSLAHWAAKRGDLEMLQTLNDFGANLNLAATTGAKMFPIHWAASEGKIFAIRFLLDNRVDINMQDENGCTPVVVAAQHEQTNCVAFLIKKGCDMGMLDVNGDSALHWAAYKGFEEVAGLLFHCSPTAINLEDIFGQTPVHLAALRGNEAVVEYLVRDCGADLTKRDKNGQTPLDLSVKKGQLKAEWTLRRLTTSSTLEIFLSLGRNRLKETRLWTFLLIGSNEREYALWPWRIVFVSNVIGTLVAFNFIMSEALTDLYFLHTILTMLTTGWWIAFGMCLWKTATPVRDPPVVASGRKSFYDEALDAIGNAQNEIDLPNVCHTCRILKPLRSKHCKVQRKCIHKFDHFCPFVYNTVSRDNYKYFIACISSHFLGSICWMITAFYLAFRVHISWWLVFYMLYTALWMLMIAGLTSFHVQIMIKNLSTNEYVGQGKYSYLHNAYGTPDNPFDKGSAMLNIFDSLFPCADDVFYSRAEAVRSRERYAQQQNNTLPPSSSSSLNKAEEGKSLLRD